MVPFAELLQVESVHDDEVTITSVGSGFLFGGLSLAVALRAAAETVAPALVPMSMHASFHAPGDWAGPHVATVQRVADTRSFATRRLDVVNSGRVAVSATVTFHLPEEGEDWDRAPAIALAPPEELEGEAMRTTAEVAHIRPRQPASELLEPVHPFWCRIDELPEDPLLRCCAVAFVSDYLVITTPFERGQGAGSRMLSRTLDHSIWFHRPPSDDWWYSAAEPLVVVDGRYVSRGTIQERGGALLASWVQEGFLRPQR